MLTYADVCQAAHIFCVFTSANAPADAALRHLSSRVRVMGNGMVRLKRDVFEQRGGMLFARERQY